MRLKYGVLNIQNRVWGIHGHTVVHLPGDFEPGGPGEGSFFRGVRSLSSSAAFPDPAKARCFTLWSVGGLDLGFRV